jgi:serine protease Do
MRRNALFIVVAAALLFIWSGHGHAGDVSGNKAELIHGLLPSVVNLTVRKEVAAATGGSGNLAAGQTENSKIFVGSGFVFDASGLIATNYHVVENAYEISVTFSDGSVLPGKVLHASRMADLAIVQVHADHPLTPLQWGNSTKLQIGDEVFAIGNALDIGESVTAGIVSGLDRNVQDSPYDHYIQTDAAINHGNSGGPLFDKEGHVVGVNTEILSPTESFSGISLAIPADSARFVIDQLMKYGWVHPGWIGVKVQQVTHDMAKALGMEHARGSIVSWLSPDAPAQKAGIEIGDVIIRFDNDAPQDDRALLRDIARAPEGQHVQVVVLRAGVEQTIPLTVAAWPRSRWDQFDAPLPVEEPKPVRPDLGLTFAPVPTDGRAKLGLEDGWGGVLVSAVTPNSDAAHRGLSVGDVLLRVQDKTVASPAEAKAALAEERAAKRQFAILLVLQKARKVPGPSWLAVRLPEPETP